MKKRSIWYSCLLLSLLFCLIISLFQSNKMKAVSQDDYDSLRGRWLHSLTGGTSYDLKDKDIQNRIAKITDKGQSAWDDLMKADGQTFLFKGYPSSKPTQNITESYGRLKDMALAYSTYGSPLFKDQELRNDILFGIDWLHENWYYSGMQINPQSPDNNWFVWELGTPLNLVDVLGLMYEDLTQEQIAENLAAIDYYLPNPNKLGKSVGWNMPATGANLAWAATAVGKRGIIGKNSDKIKAATTSLSPLFKYASDGSDGFYKDGSVLFHSGFPYSTGYGWSNLIEPAKAISLYENSPWSIDNPEKANLIDWVLTSYEPLIYKNRIFDNLDGREITRQSNTDKADPLIPAIIHLIPAADAAQASHLKRLIKYLVLTDPTFDYYQRASLPEIVEIKKIINDPSISQREPLNLYKQFPNMDRNVVQRDNFMFGVAMHSSRVGNYESINFENLAGWHTSDGRTTLYNNDLTQFSDGYWPTVDASRLPGTTVQRHKSDDVFSPQIGKVKVTGSTELEDHLNDFSKIFYRSPMWEVDDSKHPAFKGDQSRLKRKQNSYEYIIYKTENMTQFEVDLFFTEASNLERVEVLASKSNDGYAKIKTTYDTAEATAKGWYNATLKNENPLPKGTNFLKIQFIPSVTSGTSDQDWVGGVDIDGKFGISGMQLHPNNQPLTAKKSWFMFDDEIVALGSDISTTDHRHVETIVENRKLSDPAKQAVSAEGRELSTTQEWEEEKTLKWAHLKGNVSGSDTGYVFPDGSDVTLKSEARTGSWSMITGNGSTDQITRNYFSLILNHGMKPKNKSYSYILLPDADQGATERYAKNSDVSVVENSSDVHAVKENKLNILGANFWNDHIKTLKVDGKDFLTVDRKASVMTRESDGELSLSLTDPTWKNNKGGILIDDAQSFNNIYARSEDWMLEVGGGYKRRSSTSTQYLIYQLDNVKEFEAVLRYNFADGNNKPILDRVKFYASEDSVTFKEVQAEVTDEQPASGGLSRTATVVSKAIPQGTNYLKVEFVGNQDAQVWSPQLRHMKIIGEETGNGYIHVELNRKAEKSLIVDERVQVLQLSPTIKLKVDVDSLKGQSVKAKFTNEK